MQATCLSVCACKHKVSPKGERVAWAMPICSAAHPQGAHRMAGAYTLKLSISRVFPM